MSRPFNTPDVFRAIGHPVRRRILDLLRVKERSVNDLLAQFQLAQSTFSEHLRTLRLAGLIQYRGQGAKLVYRIVPASLHEIEAWLASHRGGSSKSRS